MRTGMASQRDVARRARVSFMTVSRVINKHPSVRPETRERVLRAIKDLAYYPNAAARALNSSRSHNVGIIFPRRDYLLVAPFCVELCAEVEAQLRRRGYHLFLGSTAEERESGDLYTLFKEGKVDGMIVFAPARDDPRIARLAGDHLPFVVVHGRSRRGEFSYVDSDNSRGMALLLEYLFELGHRRIGFVTGSLAEVNSQDRLRRYRRELRLRGLTLEDALVCLGDWTLESGYAGFRKLMENPRPPTAICFSNDQMAIGALKAAHDLGLGVPRDVSITGYDDIKYASFTAPALTTVRQHIGEVGDKVAELLLERMEARSREPRRIILEPELVVRESCHAIRPFRKEEWNRNR
ncbi:MAG TPA: LacI family DNA-binding transcriptional regulator [Anaeromyxobacteraceae bacterium]|nr:LacI family DNA-binding transcriptional regulator [Anaeromyxobacteraceae bacterium]